MTEIDPGFYETSQFSRKDDSLKSVDYPYTLWSESQTLYFLSSSNSPSSTKSAYSIPDSLHHSSHEPSSPWRNDDEEEEEPNWGSQEEKEVLTPGKDCELEEALSYFWPSMQEEQEVDGHRSKPLSLNTELVPQAPSPLSFSSVTLEVQQGEEKGADEREDGVVDSGEVHNRLKHHPICTDTVWTATTEFPALAADDIDQVLNGRLQQQKSPNNHTMSLLYSCKRTHSPSPSSSISFEQPRQSFLSKSRLGPDKLLSDQYQSISIDGEDDEEEDDDDGEETDTGSEAEECRRALSERYNTMRPRKKVVLYGREEIVEDLNDGFSSSESEDSEFGYLQKPRKFVRSSAHRLEAPMESWWPDASRTEATKCLPANSTPAKCCLRKNRKQYELWEFILKSLNSQKSSAFRWVNKSIGVFRITDTRKAAREWGRYRNNSRMDYEKMARAMRFYYKASVLRKAHKQLHFQFSMKYVTWSEHHHLANE